VDALATAAKLTNFSDPDDGGAQPVLDKLKALLVGHQVRAVPVLARRPRSPRKRRSSWHVFKSHSPPSSQAAVEREADRDAALAQQAMADAAATVAAAAAEAADAAEARAAAEAVGGGSDVAGGDGPSSAAKKAKAAAAKASEAATEAATKAAVAAAEAAGAAAAKPSVRDRRKLTRHQQAALHFALFKAYDERADWPSAAAQLEAANAHRAQLLRLQVLNNGPFLVNYARVMARRVLGGAARLVSDFSTWIMESTGTPTPVLSLSLTALVIAPLSCSTLLLLAPAPRPCSSAAWPAPLRGGWW